MKRNFLFLILFITIIRMSFGQVQYDPTVEKYAQTITAQDLLEYLHIIASDSLQGRETGEPGQKKAANYLASKFKEFGLKPGAKGSYFQKFDLIKKQWQEVYLIVNEQKKTFLEDFYVWGDLNFPKEVTTETVFAGYGIETSNYSDYKTIGSKKLNVKNKAVIIFPGDPIVDGKSLITGDSNLSSWANDWGKKVELAKSKGAKAVFIVVGKNLDEFNNRLKKLKHHISKPTLGFKDKERASAFFIPIDMAASILNTSVEKIKTSLSDTSRTITIKGNVGFKCSIKETTISTENVLGFIEGTDKKDEIIVITAHYDHLGMEGEIINYGADDDGSGTVALLEIAQAFAKAKADGKGPRRSILIMPVTGEEKGLMGSEYYSDHPIYSLNKTVADLNIDMIGRLDDEHKKDTNYVYIIGSNRLSTDLHQINEEVNNIYSKIHLDYKFNSFNDPNRFYYRSDHYNFAKHNIPVIFYFNGVHEDYHKPTDTVDKIIFPKVESITRLVFYTAWELANREERIKVNVKEK